VDHDKDGKPVDEADQTLFSRRAAGGFDGRVRDAALLGSFG
jgi:hypothetical protein